MTLIDPSGIPGAHLDLRAVREGASGIAANGGVVRDQGAEIVRDWQRLPGVFEATGTESVYAAMTPVGTTTAAIGDSLAGIARALSAYATEVEPIKARLDALRSQAKAFAAKAKSFSPHLEMVSSGYTFGIPVPEKVDSWDEDPHLNDENNSLIRQVAAAEAEWLDAQQRCATAIRAAVGLAAKGAADERAIAEQLRSDDQLQTTWGATSDRKESCSEKAVTFSNHFLWDGVIVGFGWNTLKGVGSLLGVDPTGKAESEMWKGFWSGDWKLWAKGQQDSLATAGHAWLGVAHLAGGLLLPPAETEAFLSSPLADWIPGDVRSGLTDWNREDGTVLYGTAAGLVGLTLPAKWWDPKAYDGFNPAQNWVDNPGGTLGTSAATIASFFIPGAGEARGAGIAGDAAKVAEGARVGDLLADGSIASLRGLSADALKATIRGISDADAAKLASELAKPELDAGALSALKLDDLTIHEPPAPPVEPPVREAADLPAADHGAGAEHHPAPGAGVGPVDDAAGRAETVAEPSAPGHDVAPGGSAGDGAAVPEPPVRPGPDDVGLHEHLRPDDAPAARHFDLLDPAVQPTEGAGWKRLPDEFTLETPHGDVLPQHGSPTPPAEADFKPKSASLRLDPEAPYGRFPDGRPLSLQEFDERFSPTDRSTAYPDNAGAVEGTRVSVSDLRVYLREFGPQIDRIGGRDGSYLGAIIDSSPSSFEARSLPPRSLLQPYESYVITADRLPEDWTVEVSRIAPGFGRGGGGIQLQFFDATGAPVSVERMLPDGAPGEHVLD